MPALANFSARNVANTSAWDRHLVAQAHGLRERHLLTQRHSHLMRSAVSMSGNYVTRHFAAIH